MSGDRVATAFARARSEGRAALVAYLTAYDGGPEHSLSCVRAAIDAGADVIELGIPFSDPSADGPAICAAMVRAREQGATVDRVLELLATLRRSHDAAVVLFGYANPLLHKGGEAFAAAAAQAGADGVLVVDAPPESAAPLREPARAHGLHWIPLVAPTTTAERRTLITAGGSGFVYAITLAGVTGAALQEQGSAADATLRAQLEATRAVTSLPVAAGFGVRRRTQVLRLAALADGVVVGTALVEAAQRGPRAVTELVHELREGCLR